MDLISKAAWDIINEIANENIKNDVNEEVVDMCKAIEDIKKEITYANVIRTAKRDYKRGKYSENEIVSDISNDLNINKNGKSGKSS